MQLTRCRIKTVVRVDESDMLYRSTVSLSLEQCPRIGFHIIDVLLRIPDREISNSGACIHLDESVSYACIGRAKCIARLSIVPPAFNTSVIVRCIFTDTHFKNGSENFSVIDLRISPVTAKLHSGMEAQNVFKMEIFLAFRTSLTNSDILCTKLCTTEFIISGRYIHYPAAAFISSVNSRLKSRPVVKSRFGFSTEGRVGHNKVGYRPVLCRINGFDTLLEYLLFLRLRTSNVHRKQRQQNQYSRRP